VFTFNRRCFVNRTAADYKKDLLHRLWAVDITDEEFIERFCKRHEVERDLKSADSDSLPGTYEEALDSLVEGAQKDYEILWSEPPVLIHENREQQHIRPRRRRWPRKQGGVAGPWERQEALARYLAAVASEDEKIISFRKDVLSGRVLSEEEALTFLSSPVAGAKSRATFKMIRVNPLKRILDTNYQVREEQDDFGAYRKLVWGRRRSSTVRPLGVVATKLIFPGDVVTSDSLRGLRSKAGRTVVFPHPREEDRFVVAKPESIIGEIVKLVEKCMSGYPISLEMGVWFILTSEFIPEDPVRTRYMTTRRPELMSRTTITLEVESWLPLEEVLEQFRHAQSKILGKTPRSLKRRTLSVLQFVNQHREKSWRELFDAWNEAHPRQRFKDRSHLYTTYTRAVERVVGVKPVKG
jgi:hypothetical protein